MAAMNHLPLPILIAVGISTLTAVAMSLFAGYVARNRKNDRKSISAKQSDVGSF